MKANAAAVTIQLMILPRLLPVRLRTLGHHVLILGVVPQVLKPWQLSSVRCVSAWQQDGQ
jgi:hypothetical protein